MLITGQWPQLIGFTMNQKTTHSDNIIQKILFWSRRGKRCPKRSTEGCEGCDSQHVISGRSDLDPKMEVR